MTDPSPAEARPRLSVVIPVYNEIKTLETVLDRVREVDVDKEIILVDDGSEDGSRELITKVSEEDPRVRGFLHEQNKGKGAALKTGFSQARGEVVVIQDADLEYNPADYPALLKPFEEADADVVFGSRFLIRDYARVHLFWHYLGNRMLTFMSNVFTGLNLTDMETCYKAFKREVIQQIDVKSKRFTIEPELTAKIARMGLKVYEVPISYAGRSYGEGKKITWKDGIAALWAIVRFRFWD